MQDGLKVKKLYRIILKKNKKLDSDTFKIFKQIRDMQSIRIISITRKPKCIRGHLVKFFGPYRSSPN